MDPSHMTSMFSRGRSVDVESPVSSWGRMGLLCGVDWLLNTCSY